MVRTSIWKEAEYKTIKKHWKEKKRNRNVLWRCLKVIQDVFCGTADKMLHLVSPFLFHFSCKAFCYFCFEKCDKFACLLIASSLVFQGSTIARQIAAVAYVECTSKVSENSVRDVFHVTTVASVRRPHKPQLKRSSSRRGLKRVSQLPLPPLPGRTEQMDQAPAMRKDRAKSCVLM